MNSSASPNTKKPYLALGVVGPTASGKSALSIRLAQELEGEVINVDSVQVYKDLSIGAAKLPLEERQGVPHHCLDIFSPATQANVAQFKGHALNALEDITTRKKLPILVGGSGMYLTILLHGIAELPDVAPETRAKIQELSNEAIYSALQAVDSTTASRLHPNDRQRVSRALEVWETTKVAPSELYSTHQFKESPVQALLIVLCHSRESLYERINQRSQEMLKAGLIEETQSVIDRYGDSPLLTTIGYAQAKAYLAGELPKEQLAHEIALHTRQYAKRQMTYLRNEPRKRGWKIRPADTENGVILDESEVGTKRTRRASEPLKGFRVMPFTEEGLIEAVRRRLREGISGSEVWYVALGAL